MLRPSECPPSVLVVLFLTEFASFVCFCVFACVCVYVHVCVCLFVTIFMNILFIIFVYHELSECSILLLLSGFAAFITKNLQSLNLPSNRNN